MMYFRRFGLLDANEATKRIFIIHSLTFSPFDALLLLSPFDALLLLLTIVTTAAIRSAEHFSIGAAFVVSNYVPK